MADGRPASPVLPVTALTLNALIWGLSWWPFRALDALGVHALWATALVFSLAFGVVWLGVQAWRPQALRGALASGGLCLLALAAGLTNVGFNWAVTTGDVVRVVLLFYLMPAWVVLLAWPLLGEQPGLGALFAAGAGLGWRAAGTENPLTPPGRCPRACPTGWRWPRASVLRSPTFCCAGCKAVPMRPACWPCFAGGGRGGPAGGRDGRLGRLGSAAPGPGV